MILPKGNRDNGEVWPDARQWNKNRRCRAENSRSRFKMKKADA